MFVPHQSRDSSSRHLSRSHSGKPLSEDERRERLREAGRLKLNMFKQRQLQELQRNENGPFANLLAIASPLVSMSDMDNGTDSQHMGSPMSKRQHSRHTSSSCSRQPDGDAVASSDAAAGSHAAASGGAAAGDGPSTETAAQPKIKPVFRPIRTASKEQPPATQQPAVAAPGPAADQIPNGDGLEDMVQILLQQVAQLQTEKQQILQRCSALELENANLQELVGFLSEAADLTPTDGSLEVCEQDLEEIYTVIVEDDQQPPESPEAAGGNPANPALSTPE